jgi:hypothetical protein
MALNPSIALGVKGIEVANPLAQYTQVAQLQAMQNQNQVSQMQLDQMRRDDETLKQIQAKAVEHGGPADINQIANAYINSGNPKFMEFGISLRQKLDARSAFERAMNLGNAPQGAPAPAAPATNALAPTMQAGALGSGTFGMAPEPRANQLAPAPVAAAPAAPAGRDINALRARRDALLLVDDPRAAAAVQSLNAEIALASKVNTAAPGSAILDSQGRIVGNVPEATSADVRTMKELGYPLTQAGYAAFRDAQRQERLLTPAEKQQKIDIALASRAPAQPSAPVAIVADDGKIKYVSREEAMGKTPASALEGLAPKEIQAREAKYPAATSAIKTFETSADKLAGDLEKLASHPGLSGISGLIYGRTPAITKDARAAQALYDSIVARGGFQELQNMRSASPTGGALGNVSNQEGQYLRDAFAPISRTQDTTDLSRSLREAAGATRSSKQRLREAYDMTYDYKNQGGARPAPAAGGAAPAAGGGVVDFGSLR